MHRDDISILREPWRVIIIILQIHIHCGIRFILPTCRLHDQTHALCHFVVELARVVDRYVACEYDTNMV